MSHDNRIISKGTYQYSQVNKFISVKDYIFVRSEGKKGLLLRFINYADYAINSMSFALIQMNSAGEVLARTDIDYSDLNIGPDHTYSPSKAIVVNEYCSDFKVVFSTVCSGEFIYEVHEGKVTAYYDLPDSEIISGEAVKKPIATAFSVKKRNFGKPRLAVFLSSLLVVIMIAANIGYVFYTYLDSVPDERENAAQETEAQVQEQYSIE